MDKVAWRVKVRRITDDPCIVAAETRPLAVAQTLRAVFDAGYYAVKYIDIVATRAPELDAWAVKQEAERTWDEKHLLSLHGPAVAAALGQREGK